jgi:hypothetical protein
VRTRQLLVVSISLMHGSAKKVFLSLGAVMLIKSGYL